MPCRPPTTLVSIVGHASFHTAGASGPSIIERSYLRRPGFPVVSEGTAIEDADAAGAAVTSVNSLCRASSDQGIDTPRTRASEHEVEEDETVKDRGRPPVHRRPERHRETDLEVRDSHLTGQQERD